MINVFLQVVTIVTKKRDIYTPIGKGIICWETLILQLPKKEFDFIGDWMIPNPLEVLGSLLTLRISIDEMVGTFIRKETFDIESLDQDVPGNTNTRKKSAINHLDDPAREEKGRDLKFQVLLLQMELSLDSPESIMGGPRMRLPKEGWLGNHLPF